MDELTPYIADKIAEEIISIKPVSGGDISSAYRLETANARYFLKVNNGSSALQMFHAEQKGLQAIEATGTIAVPHVHIANSVDGQAFLLMDHVDSKRPNASDYQRLGRELAELHQFFLDPSPTTRKTDRQLAVQDQSSGAGFGFSSDNFIGSLPQSNRSHVDWPEFYWFERIFPQLQMARQDELISEKIIPKEENAIALFRDVFAHVKPSLLHGDLWGGNYLIATDGTPYLIDPAVYHGHSMVDIAMSRLFGGFGTDFYTAYHDIIPEPENYDIQIDLYQLYYLLVHLNLFGSGYYSSVASLLKKYF
jgi:fructosamine-3-kinase